MPSFTIYQSEYAVRTENTRLRSEIESLRSENNDLRRQAGLEEKAYQPIGTGALGANGESFKAGNCTVSISAPGARMAHAPMMQSPQMGAAQAQVTEAGQNAWAPPEVQINAPAQRREVAQGGAPAQPQLTLVPQAQAAQAAPQTPQRIETTGKEGQKVTITAGPPPMLNPAIARARGVAQAPRIPAAAPTQAQSTVQTYNEVETDETSMRMSLLEL